MNELTPEEKNILQLYRVSKSSPPERLGVVGLWATLFPVVLALSTIVLDVPLIKVLGLWYLVLLLLVLVG